MASRGRGRRGRPRGASQAPPVFDQQAFTEVVGIAVAAIARVCAVVNQGGSNDLQRIEAHHSPLGRGGGLDDIRDTWDICVGAKRKEGPSSSSTGNRQRASSSRVPQIQGQPGPMTCFYCQQPEHMRRDCPQRQGSRGLGAEQSLLAVRQKQLQLVSPYPSMGQRDQY